MLGILELITRIVTFLYDWLLGPNRLLFRSVRFSGGGKRVLVSGCDSGIGLRLAQRLHAAGYQVLAGCLSTDSRGARELSQLEGEHPVRVFQLDITDDQSVRQAIVQAELEEKGLWGLVNNAGVCVLGEFEWLTLEQVERTINVNLLGTLRLTKACLPFVRRSKGRVVSVSTVIAVSGMPCMAAYCASKVALESFSDCLRLELARHGAHISVVRPGDLVKHTGLMDRQDKDAKAMWEGLNEEQRAVHELYMAGFTSGWVSKGGMMSPGQLDDSPVFAHIEHALGSARPRARYMSDKTMWALYLRVLALMPVFVADRLQAVFYHVIKCLGVRHAREQQHHISKAF